jgi:SAM-dependent methyltransferase
MSEQPFGSGFFTAYVEGALRSARVVVPLVRELLDPRSVVDVGCGTGAFLRVFREGGVDDVLGVDGGYVDRRLLLIPEDRFQAADLGEPLRVGREFDLALCLEVADDLAPERAEPFVRSLTALAPAVLFSAAVPAQGGQCQRNEQWPDYWIALFRERGYAAFDCIREALWNRPEVEWWYAQNTILFAREEVAARRPQLRARSREPVLPLVHPRLYLAVQASRRERARGPFPVRRIVAALRRAGARLARPMLRRGTRRGGASPPPITS